MGGGLKKEQLFTLQEVIGVLSPVETINLKGDIPVFSVAIDSREVESGGLFVPLPGRFTDGHNFIGDATKKGAAAVLIARDKLNQAREEIIGPLISSPSAGIVVKSPLKAMQALGGYYMRKVLPKIRIGITGSNGKTTTKELLAGMLSREFETVSNEKNLNSEIGLPLSVFRISKRHSHAVFELATNHPGEMSLLSDIFKPNIAVITNIGRAHMGYFGSVEGIAKEKRSIFENLKEIDGERGMAFLFEDEPMFKILTDSIDARIISFGPRTTNGFEGVEDLGLDGQIIHWEGLQIRFPLAGRHNLLNALAAMTVAKTIGVSRESISNALEEYRPLFGRSQVIRDHVTILFDCYNANPESVLQMISFLKGLRWKGRKVAVLGPMFELGDYSEKNHLEVARASITAGLDTVVLFGEEFMGARKALYDEQNSGEAGRVFWYSDFEELKRDIAKLVREGDVVLLKGSRGVEMERLLPAILPASKINTG